MNQCPIPFVTCKLSTYRRRFARHAPAILEVKQIVKPELEKLCTRVVRQLQTLPNVVWPAALPGGMSETAVLQGRQCEDKAQREATSNITMRAWPVARSIFDAPLVREANERTTSWITSNILHKFNIFTNSIS